MSRGRGKIKHFDLFNVSPPDWVDAQNNEGLDAFVFFYQKSNGLVYRGYIAFDVCSLERNAIRSSQHTPQCTNNVKFCIGFADKCIRGVTHSRHYLALATPLQHYTSMVLHL
ncbi:unnamed protein product [Ascophyllum nodosum]